MKSYHSDLLLNESQQLHWYHLYSTAGHAGHLIRVSHVPDTGTGISFQTSHREL
jgi:hypothetical protein